MFRKNKGRKSRPPTCIGELPSAERNPRPNHWEERSPWDPGLGQDNPTLAGVRARGRCPAGYRPVYDKTRDGFVCVKRSAVPTRPPPPGAGPRPSTPPPRPPPKRKQSRRRKGHHKLKANPLTAKIVPRGSDYGECMRKCRVFGTSFAQCRRHCSGERRTLRRASTGSRGNPIPTMGLSVARRLARGGCGPGWKRCPDGGCVPDDLQCLPGGGRARRGRLTLSTSRVLGR